MYALPSDRENYLVVTKTTFVASELTTAITLGHSEKLYLRLQITAWKYLRKFGLF